MSLSGAHPNADVLRRFFAAFGAADRAVMRELTTEDFSWTFPGDSGVAGTYHGVDGLVDGIRHTATTPGTGRTGFELEHVLADDDIVVTIHGDFHAGGDDTLDPRYLLVGTMVDGRMDRVHEIPFDRDGNDHYMGRQTQNHLKAALLAAAR